MAASTKEYTLEEVAKHKTQDDLWFAIDGKVYDVTAFSKKHPGGVVIMTSLGGHDCTEAFRVYHPPEVGPKYLPSMQVGVVKNYKPTQMRKDIQALNAQMEADGLYKTPVMNYVWYFSYLAAIFSVAVGCVLYSANFWVHFLGAIALGMFWQQLSFGGHDFGHNSVTPNSLWDYIGSLVVNSMYGVSGQWWKATHNVHHVVTNAVEYDPDVQYLPLFAVHTNLLRRFYSHYHKKIFSFGSLERSIVSVQHFLYLPVMALARFNLYVQSLLFLTLAPDTECRFRRSALAATGFFFVWFSWLMYQLPDTSTRVMFLLVSHAVAGIIHVQITLSHFSMPTYNGTGIVHDDPDHFVKNQLAGSMNVTCDPLLDWFHGGLQFQVEHHLFPRLPRYNLRLAKEKYVMPFLKKHNVPYTSMYFFDAIGDVISCMKKTAKVAWSLSDAEIAQRNKLSMLANAEG